MERLRKMSGTRSGLYLPNQGTPPKNNRADCPRLCEQEAQNAQSGALSIPTEDWVRTDGTTIGE